MIDIKARRGAIPPYEYRREVRECQDYIRTLERIVSILSLFSIGSVAVASVAVMELHQLGVF